MNERIQELILRSTDIVDVYNPDTGITHYREFFDKEKFAELIVQECMNAVCDPGTTYLESMTESSAMYTARERIRKHFGG
jgi:hypothetical protein